MTSSAGRDLRAEEEHREFTGWAEAQGYTEAYGDSHGFGWPVLAEAFVGGMGAERDLACASAARAARPDIDPALPAAVKALLRIASTTGSFVDQAALQGIADAALRELGRLGVNPALVAGMHPQLTSVEVSWRIAAEQASGQLAQERDQRLTLLRELARLRGQTVAVHEDDLTAEHLAYLERRYAKDPGCSVCGAPLEVVDSRGGKMACTSDGASPFTARYQKAGVTWIQSIEHYDASVRYDPPPGDPLVIRLVAEVRRHREAEAGRNTARRAEDTGLERVSGEILP